SVTHVSKVRLTFQNFEDETFHHGCVAVLGFAPQALPQPFSRKLPLAFLDHDAPLALIFVGAGLIGIPGHTEEVPALSVLCSDVPSPILLTRLVNLDPSFRQLCPKPVREVLAEAARIDEVLLDLREIETVGFEEQVLIHNHTG